MKQLQIYTYFLFYYIYIFFSVTGDNNLQVIIIKNTYYNIYEIKRTHCKYDSIILSNLHHPRGGLEKHFL